MYGIEIYEDKNGSSPVADFLQELNIKARTSKEHRIRLKRLASITAFKSVWHQGGLPTTKHISEDIWELRPTRTVYYSHTEG